MHRLIRRRYIIFCPFLLMSIKLILIFHVKLQENSDDKILLPLNMSKSGSLTQLFNMPLINMTNRVNNINVTNEYYRQYVKKKNMEQFLYNKDFYSPKTTHYILIVQVHRRIFYLKKFIETLNSVEDINQTLIIFSHDFIDSEINQLVMNIKFAPIIQIFYPYSQQLYPNEFPGLHPNDCPRNVPKHKALASRCTNAAYPDRYGHYRDASIVQIKHHWWWKLNFVFNSIEILRNRTDYLLLLLEEDFYLSPDSIFFLKRMEKEKKRLCPDCLFYTLGNLDKSGRNFLKFSSKVSISYWHARYNLGMTISYSLWRLMLKYAEDFCTIDDYNWDWSLVYLVQKRLNFPRVLWSTATRIMHLGLCGTHFKNSCSNQSEINRWIETDKFYRENRKHLFPTTPVSLKQKFETKHLINNKNGGWSDLRDQQLCFSFAFEYFQNLSSVTGKN